MTGTYRGRSRHRLPRREGARCAGRTGGVPQYVPADMYPPGTESLRKRSRCLFPPSTWHGIPAKAFQVSFPAVHLPRNPCESVPGVLSCRPPATESLRKCSRCLFPPSTWHGNPAKACQVSFPAAHLPRFSRESVPGVSSRRPPATESLRKCSRCPIPLPTWHGIPAKVFQVSFPAVHLPRNPCESVPGVSSRRPPATESLRKCSRCLFPPSTCHGIPAKAFQVSLPAVHLPRFFLRKRSRCLFPPSTWHGDSSHYGMSGLFSRTN